MGAKGSITALYTVLVEGDDMTEPIADETRSILDGHIILSRDLASANHFPAVDVLASASRVMSMIVGPEHLKTAGRLRELMAAYKRSEILIKIGEYKKGADPVIDEAIAGAVARLPQFQAQEDRRIAVMQTTRIPARLAEVLTLRSAMDWNLLPLRQVPAVVAETRCGAEQHHGPRCDPQKLRQQIVRRGLVPFPDRERPYRW